MILSKDQAPILSNIEQKIFIYDFNFNIVCEIPVTIGSNEENSLIELNELVYLRYDNSVNTELTKIDCSMLNINQLESENEFEIYPNPTNSILYLSNPQQKTLSISLVSTDGKEILNHSSQNNSVAMKLDVIPNGIYFLKINDGIRTYVKRVIKE
ncbi:MAG: T9SS type A sorting domain-containing protein [Flavobacteriia bacterium]|nr:T9SS type A sorting domain-containing protein [Flavobacteriia bacterium]